MASDNFNRADAALSAPWAKQAGSNFTIVSNAVRSDATNDSYWYYSGAATSADQYSEAVEIAIPFEDWGPAVRIAGNGSINHEGYFYGQYGGNEIGKHVNGSYSSISSGVGGSTTGDVARIEAEGTAIRVYSNGGLVASATDSSLTGAGDGVGLFIYEGGGTGVDNWQGGDLNPPATYIPRNEHVITQAVIQASLM